MKSFRQYLHQTLNEVISFENNSQFVVANKELNVIEDEDKEHPSAFPDLFFPGHPYQDEDFDNARRRLVAGKGLSGPKRNPLKSRPTAESWGRIDHNNKVLHIVTGNAEFNVTETGYDIKLHTKKAEKDAFDRIHAIELLKAQYPDFRVHVGNVPKNREAMQDRKPITLSYEEYTKSIIKALDNHLE